MFNVFIIIRDASICNTGAGNDHEHHDHRRRRRSAHEHDHEGHDDHEDALPGSPQIIP